MFRWVRLASSPEGDGCLPYANERGLFHGRGTPLLEKDRHGAWRPRSKEELKPILEAGYGGPIQLDRRMASLETAARALNANNPSLAAIALVHADFPPLPDEAAAMRMAQMDRLVKFDPAQARIPRGSPGGGRWTRDEDEDEQSDKPNYRQIMSPECEEEWAWAHSHCGYLRDNNLFGTDNYRGLYNYDQCRRGMVSQACGGNRVK